MKTISRTTLLALGICFSNLYSQNTIGICPVFDNKTNLNRSFAILNGFSKMELEDKVPFAKLLEVPSNSVYSITGKTFGEKFLGKFYKNGKKIKTIQANSLDNLIEQITQFMLEEKVVFKGKPLKIDEGNGIDFPESKIQDLFPKEISLEVNNSWLYNELIKFYKLDFKNEKPDVGDISLMYGNYTKIDEKDLFFFRNKNIPSNLKDVVKPVVMPLYQNVLVPINYLNYAIYFDLNKEYGKAYHMYLSAINTSININGTTEMERSLFRKIGYGQLYHLQNKISEKRNGLKNLYLLAWELNNNYFNSAEAKKADSDFSANLSKLKEFAKSAEENAKEIRSQKFSGGLMAFTGALQSVNASGALTGSINNTIDYTQFFQSSSVAYANANQLQNNLTAVFSGIKEKINPQDFVIEGVQLENLESPIGIEVLRFLTISPETSRLALVKFAEDKPVLKKILNDFYSNKDQKNIVSVVNQITKIELLTSYFESRNLDISPKALAEF